MSASFSVVSATGSYDVSVAAGSFVESLTSQHDTQIIADEFFRSAIAPKMPAPIFLTASEPQKSLDRMPALMEQMRSSGIHRGSLLLAVGGGVIQDLSAFIASVYMRGLPWNYIPTTVLAMVDSCIGGKSSINVGPYKNLVGTFHPPQHILIDPALAATLPSDQFASGLIEAAKICFCRGERAFEQYLACEPSVSMSIEALEQLILTSLLAKKHFIEVDEFDKNERLLLNFGHTFGHAIEGASHYAVPHGIAVGLGILCSLEFQRRRGVPPQVPRLEHYLDGLIRTLPALGDHLRRVDIADVMERFASDKKHSTQRYTLVLVSGGGAVILEQIERSAASERGLRSAIETTLERYTR